MARFAGDIFTNKAEMVAQMDVDGNKYTPQPGSGINYKHKYIDDLDNGVPTMKERDWNIPDPEPLLVQLTPSMMDPLLMDDDELEIRGLGVPQIRSLDYEKSIIKTPSAAGANYYYDQARPGGRHL